MNPLKISLVEQVASLLARGEPMTAAELRAATGKSQPSISLAIQALGDRVCKIGAARSTRYALKKAILGLNSTQELRWMGDETSGFSSAQMTYLEGNWLYVECQTADGHAQQWLSQDRLPWFLSTLKPQGYLGRKLAQWLPQLPSDPEKWSLEQLLYSLTFISDPIGAIDVVAETVRPTRSRIIRIEDRQEIFDTLASDDSHQRVAGSSAAGEQPKFVTDVQGQACLVKFAPPKGTPFGQRWRALLALEKLALDTLDRHGIPSSQALWLESSQRSYLQSSLFDHAADGKRHVVAIAALHDEFTPGTKQHWVHTAQGLHAKKLITKEELRTIATIHAFGHYIGNTDMHFGNLSFFVDDVITPKIRLAPVYDMLPMMWRPDPHAGLTDSPVRPQPMPAGFAAEQEQAREWAIEFWEQAAQLDIGADLQAAAQESARRLKSNFAQL